MSRISVASQWLDYRFKAVPVNATDYQIDCTERAYYAGASMVLWLLAEMSSASEAEGRELLQSLAHEVRDFAVGRAATPAPEPELLPTPEETT
jgi:hypothetical protein